MKRLNYFLHNILPFKKKKKENQCIFKIWNDKVWKWMREFRIHSFEFKGTVIIVVVLLFPCNVPDTLLSAAFYKIAYLIFMKIIKRHSINISLLLKRKPRFREFKYLAQGCRSGNKNRAQQSWFEMRYYLNQPIKLVNTMQYFLLKESKCCHSVAYPPITQYIFYSDPITYNLKPFYWDSVIMSSG